MLLALNLVSRRALPAAARSFGEAICNAMSNRNSGNIFSAVLVNLLHSHGDSLGLDTAFDARWRLEDDQHFSAAALAPHLLFAQRNLPRLHLPLCRLAAYRPGRRRARAQRKWQYLGFLAL